MAASASEPCSRPNRPTLPLFLALIWVPAGAYCFCPLLSKKDAYPATALFLLHKPHCSSPHNFPPSRSLIPAQSPHGQMILYGGEINQGFSPGKGLALPVGTWTGTDAPAHTCMHINTCIHMHVHSHSHAHKKLKLASFRKPWIDLASILVYPFGLWDTKMTGACFLHLIYNTTLWGYNTLVTLLSLHCVFHYIFIDIGQYQ